MGSLTKEQALALLGGVKTPKEPVTSTGGLTLIEKRLGVYRGNTRNTKHVQWCNDEMQCVSRRCGSPTYIKVMGAPTCMVHAIDRLAQMLDPKPVIEGEL